MTAGFKGQPLLSLLLQNKSVLLSNGGSCLIIKVGLLEMYLHFYASTSYQCICSLTDVPLW